MNPLILKLIENPSLIANIPQMLALFTQSPPKDGHKTTEFWLTTAFSAYMAIAPGVPEPWSIVVPTGLIGIYTIARAAVKIAHALGRMPNVDDLPDLSTLPNAPK